LKWQILCIWSACCVFSVLSSSNHITKTKSNIVSDVWIFSLFLFVTIETSVTLVSALNTTDLNF
jgi:hypothetical protein